VNGPVPVGFTDKVLDCPEVMDDGDAIGAEVDGGTHELLTVTVVAGLSAAGAHWPVTRTQ
jgi:hypothetical protein